MASFIFDHHPIQSNNKIFFQCKELFIYLFIYLNYSFSFSFSFFLGLGKLVKENISQK
jgi:hypothetical protein